MLTRTDNPPSLVPKQVRIRINPKGQRTPLPNGRKGRSFPVDMSLYEIRSYPEGRGLLRYDVKLGAKISQ